MDRFGASDAWLMFAMYMGANDHRVSAFFGFTICALVCFLPDKRSTPPSPEGANRNG